MRIDLNRPSLNEIVRDEPSQKIASKTGALSNQSSSANPSVEDKATLSSDAVTLSSLEAKALATPAVRQDRVDALRQAIQNGEYKLEPKVIANAMIEHFRR